MGNKSDLERDVTYEEGQELAENLGCKFCETSAKNGRGVKEAFVMLYRQILAAREAGSKSPAHSEEAKDERVSLVDGPGDREGCSC